MDIVFVITRADQVGGATVHVRDMCKALIARGDNVTVLVGGNGPVTVELAANCIPYRSMRHLVRLPNPIRDLLAVIEIARHLQELKPDLVSTQTAKAGLIGRIASNLVGVPAIFTPHGWAIADRITSSGGFLFRLAEKAGARFSARIVNVCEYEKELAIRHHIAPERSLVTVHNGMPDVPFSLRAEPDRQPPRLIMVARMDKPKDHMTLLRAMANLTDLPWTLEMVGGGPRENSIRALAAQLEIGDRICYRGSIGNVAELLCESGLFVLSSQSEAFPLSILEAMRAGLPVVATDVGGVSEAVLHNRTGFLVPKNNPELLSYYLRRLISDPGLRRQLGTAGRLRYESHFTFEQMLSKYIRVYDEILGQPPGLALAPSGGA